MENGSAMINNIVYKNFRNNIIVDKYNYLLTAKANKDRFNKRQGPYAGYPRLGSVRSEDALVWNFMRTLSFFNDFSSLEKLIKIDLNNPKILLWALPFEEENKELRHRVRSIIRSIDGKVAGPTTEPDIIVETDEYFVIIECKLGEIKKYPPHLWDSKGTNGPERRYEYYFGEDLFVRSSKSKSGYKGEAYQLFRMVFYTCKIAEEFGKIPVFVSLTNKTWWNKKTELKTRSPKDIWKIFEKQVKKEKVKLMNVFWQDLEIKDTLHILRDYLRSHECLYSKPGLLTVMRNKKIMRKG